MKVLVCGGRDFDDWGLVCDTLDKLRGQRGAITHIIHGAASGADSLSGHWAKMRAIQVIQCPANWDFQGPAAGPIRNAKMLALQPDLVVAFPGGKGTAHMVELAKAAGVEVIQA